MVRSWMLWVTVFVIGLACAKARADRVTLNDGTVLEGIVIPRGDGYWIKTADGESHMVDKADVKSVVKTPIDSAPPSASAVPVAPPHPAAGMSFSVARARAAEVDFAQAAVTIWQNFIDQNPTSPDMVAAKDELARWKTLADAGAERINGKWVSGDDLKKLQAQVDQLANEAAALMDSKQTLKALAKLQDAYKIYPNSPGLNYMLGFLSMHEKKFDDALRYFEVNVHYYPASAEALANVGVCLAFKQQWERAIQTMQHALEIHDSKAIAQDLVDLLAQAPMAIHGTSVYKSADAAASLLSDRYKITSSKEPLVLFPPGGGSMAHVGTGFMVTADGMILTNRHVVEGSKNFQVITADGRKLTAELVVADDKQDLALIRVKTDDKVPFIQFAKLDVPAVGAECTIMGFPRIGKLGDVKVTRGIVSTSDKTDPGQADVVLDAKVNPGNSGGPIIDRFGNVMAIVCMKSLSSATDDSYGIGISAGHIRQFLEKNQVENTPAVNGDPMSTEQIVALDRPAVVCIVATK